MSRLYDLKFDFHAVSGGIWIEECTREEDAIKEALARGDAIILEVAAVGEVMTVHAVAQDDMATFATLGDWAAFECSGREVEFESTFYRVDVEPVEVTAIRSGGIPPQQNPTPRPPVQEGDEQGGGGAGPVKARPPGEEPPPEGQVKPKPRGR